MSEANVLKQNLEQSAAVVQKHLKGRSPRIGLVLGSGLNHLGDQIEHAIRMPFQDIPYLKMSTAEGHVGQLIAGTFGGVEVLCMQGRLHGYEDNSAQEVAYPIWLLAQLGINTLITTNAAGAINENYQVGDFCIMSDHINFTGRNPVANLAAAHVAQRFFSMTDAFDPELRALAKHVAQEKNIRVQEGVYLGLLGPSFETPAEIRMFRTWGADTVAMSVVEEVIAARHQGMRVLGISLVSNMAAGIEGSSPSGEEVMEVATSREDAFVCFIKGIVEQL